MCRVDRNKNVLSRDTKSHKNFNKYNEIDTIIYVINIYIHLGKSFPINYTHFTLSFHTD